jgi:arylformamidase
VKYIWLSHIIDNETPLYGGQKEGIRIETDKSIDAGDSCNTSKIQMPVHAGTHVDAPRHFLVDGKCVDAFEAEHWVFRNPFVVSIHVSPGQIIQPEDLVKGLPKKTDLCLFKTGFEKLRKSDTYWKNGPGIVPEVAEFLKESCPGIKAIGMDFISISSLAARDLGRQAHRAFLERDILIIEDMKLGEIKKGGELAEVICLPLRVTNGDGAPCSIIGTLSDRIGFVKPFSPFKGTS